MSIMNFIFEFKRKLKLQLFVASFIVSHFVWDKNAAHVGLRFFSGVHALHGASNIFVE